MKKERALIEPVSSNTVSEQVYNKIKTAILIGEFAPGERIIQENITQQLNVSRTPVREALQRLSSEGLVTIRPFYGAQVFNLSIQNLQEIYDIRILIECYAARKSCHLLEDADIDELEAMNNMIRDKKNSISDCMAYDRAFHQSICFASLSDYIIHILQGIWDKCDPYKSLYFTSPENLVYMIEEHDQVISSLRRRDEDAVAEAIRQHLEDVVDKISKIKEQIQP
jgi:DNA-binding GntR family transcriptional regulator